MATDSSPRSREADQTAQHHRHIQADIDQKDQARLGRQQEEHAVQAGVREYPSSFPKQHHAKPGQEAKLEPRPMYDAPGYKGSEKLQDMVAIITGADSGIGRAVAVLYAREGADVAIVYLNEHEDAEETRRAVESEGRRAILIPGDVTDPEFCRSAVEETTRQLGRLDILVNNAAFQEHADSLEDISEKQLDRTFKTNIYGYFHMARAALPPSGRRQRHHQHRVRYRDRGEPGSARLLRHQGRHSRLHQISGPEPGGEGYPGELRSSGAGL